MGSAAVLLGLDIECEKFGGGPGGFGGWFIGEIGIIGAGGLGAVGGPGGLGILGAVGVDGATAVLNEFVCKVLLWGVTGGWGLEGNLPVADGVVGPPNLFAEGETGILLSKFGWGDLVFNRLCSWDMKLN